MSFAKRHPGFVSGLVAAIILLGGSGWAWTYFSARDNLLQGQIAQLENEKGRLLGTIWHEDRIQEIRAQQKQLSERTAAFKTRMGNLREPKGDDATSRTEAYFALVAFAEKWREHSQGNHVRLKAREYFGFAAYANSGPQDDDVAVVLAQMRALDRLLAMLMAARPAEMVEVRRNKTGRAEPPDNYFEPSPALQTEKKGGMWFQLVFTGSTQTLRDLLNALGALDSNLLARDVLVEANANEPGGDMRGGPVVEVVPLVISKFTVIVESRSWPSGDPGDL